MSHIRLSVAVVLASFCSRAASEENSADSEAWRDLLKDASASPRRATTIGCSCPLYSSFFTGDGLWRPPQCPITQTFTTTTSTTTITTTLKTSTTTLRSSTTVSVTNSSNCSNATLDRPDCMGVLSYLEVHVDTNDTSNTSTSSFNYTLNTSYNTTTLTTTTTSTTSTTSTTTITSTTTPCQCFFRPPFCPDIGNDTNITLDFSGCEKAIFAGNLTNLTKTKDTTAANFSNDTVICICYNTTTITYTTTTITTTSTNVTTTTSTTSSSTTSTLRSSTSSTTTSRTSTSTTSTTSSTSTSTSTTTTTTRAFACNSPCPLYPRTRCKNAIEAGESCSTPTVISSCVVQGSYTFDCPWGNGDPLRSPTLRGGNTTQFRIRCRVCGIAVHFNDTDPRLGWISGSISFGQNALDGYVNESLVSSYVVYFVDGCGVPLGRPVAHVPRQAGLPTFCCLKNAYTVMISARHMPSQADRFVIIPVTGAGPLPAGELTDRIFDYFVNNSVVGVAKIPATSGIRASFHSSWTTALVTFVAAVALIVAII